MPAARKIKQAAAAVNPPTANQSQPQANQPAAPGQPSGQPNLVALSAAVWETLGKVCEKESRRDDVPDGFAGHVELSIVARIAGHIYRQYFDADLTVGYSQAAAPSHTPGGDKRLIAYVLGKLNEATRAAVLRDVLADYLASKELPEVDEAIMTATDELLAALRANAPKQAKRGAVSVKHRAGNPPLSLVG